MNRELKKQIAKAFDAPTPGRKVQFIHSLPRPHISTKTFICSQIPFIKKSVWLMSILILLPVAWAASFASENTVWIVSAFTPFLALLLIAESTKSAIYGMNELEMFARFSLKSVVLARLINFRCFQLWDFLYHNSGLPCCKQYFLYADRCIFVCSVSIDNKYQPISCATFP